MEAVLERPVHDESGSVPEFDEEEYARQMGAAGIPEASPSSREDEPVTLSQAFGLPQSFDDLWPGHVYVPPRLLELENMVELANACDAKLEEKDYFGSTQDAATMITPVVRRVEGNELVSLTEKEVKAEFDVWELRRICHFILQDQGLEVKDVQGKSPSGRSIGVKNFHSSAAITEPMTSTNAEPSPLPN